MTRAEARSVNAAPREDVLCPGRCRAEQWTVAILAAVAAGVLVWGCCSTCETQEGGEGETPGDAGVAVHVPARNTAVAPVAVGQPTGKTPLRDVGPLSPQKPPDPLAPILAVNKACGQRFSDDKGHTHCRLVARSADRVHVCAVALGSREGKLACLETSGAAEVLRACGEHLEKDAGRLTCMASGSSSQQIEACGRHFGDDPARLHCIASKATVDRIGTCCTAFSERNARLECLDFAAGDGLVRLCGEVSDADGPTKACAVDVRPGDATWASACRGAVGQSPREPDACRLACIRRSPPKDLRPAGRMLDLGVLVAGCQRLAGGCGAVLQCVGVGPPPAVVASCMEHESSAHRVRCVTDSMRRLRAATR